MSDETKKAETWAEFLDAVDAWWGLDSKAWRADRSPEAMRALADAACEYAGKRVERHVAAEREAITASLEAGRIFRPPNRSADWAHGWEMACDWHAAAIRNAGLAAIRARGTTLTPQPGQAQNPGASTTVGESTGLASLCTRGPGDTGRLSSETSAAPPKVADQTRGEAKAPASPFPCDNCTGKTSHLPWCYRVEVERLTAEVERMRGVVAAAHAKADVDVEEMATQRDEARADAASLCEAMRRALRDFGGGDPWAQRNGLLAALVQLDGLVVFSNQKRIITEALAKFGGGK